ESDAILHQKRHHRHEGDALVPIDKSVVLRKPECVSRRQFRQRRLLVLPLVDRAFERRTQHALIAQAGRPAEAAKLATMYCDGLFVGDPKRLVGLAHLANRHLASAASVSRYLSMRSSAIAIVRSKSGS